MFCQNNGTDQIGLCDLGTCQGKRAACSSKCNGSVLKKVTLIGEVNGLLIAHISLRLDSMLPLFFRSLLPLIILAYA